MNGEKPIRSCFMVFALLLMGVGELSAQATRYIFFQTENNQPFYLRLLGSTLSSNASGYLLVPKLTDGTYEIQVGFAKSDVEQQFEIVVAGKDLGFSMKHELDNSWSLFNLVDFSQLKGKTIAVVIEQPIKVIEESPVVAIEDKAEKAIEKKAKNQTDTIAKQVQLQVKTPPKSLTLPMITKIYDKSSDDGVDMVYVVTGTPKNDTVIIYVPAVKLPGIAAKSIKTSETPALKTGLLSGSSQVSNLITNPYKRP